jgi:hypothetical protein
MNTTIANLNASPLVHHNKARTVNGVVRAIYQSPFAHFLLEDPTGILVCQSMNGLPGIGAHIEVNGEFFVGIPEGCSVQIAILKEQNRTFFGHHEQCSIVGCESATQPLAA